MISEADGPLRIAVAYFNHPLIADRILERHAAEKETRLIVNSSDLIRPDEGHVVYQLSEPLMRIVRESHMLRRLQVRTLGLPFPDYRNMHHKFAVGAGRVLFGSVNWTRPALSANYEFLAVSYELDWVERFTAEFDALWEASAWLDGSKDGLRMILCPVCKVNGSVDLESYGAHCINCGREFRPGERHNR